MSHWTKWWLRGEHRDADNGGREIRDRWTDQGNGAVPTEDFRSVSARSCASDHRIVCRSLDELLMVERLRVEFVNNNSLRRESPNRRGRPGSLGHGLEWYERLQSALRNARRRRRSLENNVGSPSGSRASSIAGDRSRAGSGSQVRINLRRAQSCSDYSEDSSSDSLPPQSPPQRPSSESSLGRWNTRALERPLWEPPIIDYRKFEEEGRMYDSLHRHPDTKPEEWYEYTDAEIENELLGDYHDWMADAQAEAAQAGNLERVTFYSKLSRELDIDRREPHDKLLDIRERMYKGKDVRDSHHRLAGKRTQQHFDPVRKVWQEIDSSDSDWDDEEWHIFGERNPEIRTNEARLPMTEANLRKLSTSLPMIPQQPLVHDRYIEPVISRRHFKTSIQSEYPPMSVGHHHDSHSGPPRSYYNRRGKQPPGRISRLSSYGSHRKLQFGGGGATAKSEDAIRGWRRLHDVLSEAAQSQTAQSG